MRGKLHLITSWIATILATQIISMTAMLATSIPFYLMGPRRARISVLVHVEASLHGRAVPWPVGALPTVLPRGLRFRLLGPLQHFPSPVDDIALGVTLSSAQGILFLENFLAHRFTR